MGNRRDPERIKIEILSSLTHPHVISNLHDWNTKRRNA